MKTIIRLLGSAKKYWIHLFFGMLAVILSTVAGFYAPWALRELISLASEGRGDFARQALNVGLLLLCATALQSLGSSVAGYLNHFAALRYVNELHTRLYSKLQQMSLKYFSHSRTGDLTGRIINDAIQAEALLAHVVPDIIVNFFTFFGVGCLLFTINVRLAFVSLAALPFLLAIMLWQSKQLAPTWKESLRVRGELSGTVQDNLSGIKEIQIFNRQYDEEKKVSALSWKHVKSYLKASFFFETTFPLLAFFSALGTVAVVIYGGRLLSLGEVGIGDIAAFVMYLGMFYGPIKSVSLLMEMMGEAIASCNRVFEVMDEVPDVKEMPGARSLGRVRGKIELRGLSFSYNDEIKVLDNINLIINPGENVALVGATGVGKTTVANLLNRFYDPQVGQLLIDDIDIRSVSLQSLRDNISMVLQDTFLFNGTVYENIIYGWKYATEEEVRSAARAAKAHDFIMEMENGYESVIGERGVRLSGGQRQRLSIARAILRNSPILILDEASSALDIKTEKEIQSALDKISENRTTIIISHRLSTVRDADKIVVLEGSSIAEAGTHEELMRLGRVYAGMVDSL
jgi:ABC-type multidrug transport system fused ATPase/permease subunit